MKNNKKEDNKAKHSRTQALLMPFNAGGRAADIVGFLCRGAVILLGVLGLLLFIDDALVLGYGAFEYLRLALLYCFIFCFVSVLSGRGALSAAASALCLAALLYIHITSHGGVHSGIMLPLNVFVNHAIDRITSFGYTGLSSVIIGGGHYSDAVLHGAVPTEAYSLLCMLVSFVFSVSLIKKTRLLPVYALCGIVFSVTFTYNLMESSLGFCMLTAALIGAGVLKRYDTFFHTGLDALRKDGGGFIKSTLRRLRFYSRAGISGALAAALAFAVISIPSLAVDKPYRTVEGLDSIMTQLRTRLFSTLGEDTLSGVSESYNRPRTTSPSPRPESYGTVMRVSSYLDTTVYLRGWVGELYESGSWHTDTRTGYKSRTGSFRPEDIPALFYELVDSSLLLQNRDMSTSTASHGFVYSQITTEHISIDSDMLFTPTRYDASRAISAEDTRTQAFIPWEYYCSTGMVLAVDENGQLQHTNNAVYSSYAYLPYYGAPDYEATVSEDIAVFNVVYPHLYRYLFGYIYASQLVYHCERELAALNITPSPDCIIYNILQYSDASLQTLREKILDYETYRNYIATYTYVPQQISESLILLDPGGIYSSQEKPPTANRKYVKLVCDAISDYLTNNIIYTTHPAPYPTNGEDDIVNFLRVAREGYCVQYASAAVMMLRCAGIPARYAEGYLVDSFRRPLMSTQYTSEVTGDNAHAWAEVFIDGLGWCIFEATTPYAQLLSENSSELTVETESPDETADETLPADSETSGGEQTDLPGETTSPDVTTTGGGGVNIALNTVVIAVSCAAVFLLLMTALFVALKLREKHDRAYSSLLNKTCSDGCAGDCNDFVVRNMRYAFRVLKLFSLIPGESEQLSEFAARVEEAAGQPEFGEVCNIYQKGKFGQCAVDSDCRAIAKYIIALRAHAKKSLPAPRRLVFSFLRY